jgi:hypothetical protein
MDVRGRSARYRVIIYSACAVVPAGTHGCRVLVADARSAGDGADAPFPPQYRHGESSDIDALLAPRLTPDARRTLPSSVGDRARNPRRVIRFQCLSLLLADSRHR